MLPSREVIRSRKVEITFFEVDLSSQQRLPTCDTATAPSGYSALSPNVPPHHSDDVLSVTIQQGT